ncbi:MAG: GNAT family N-acetyltransferase [Acidobacteriota bacterium]
MHACLYHPDQIDASSALLVDHPSIDDPAACHGAIIRCDEGEDDAMLARVESFCRERGRCPAVMIDPGTCPVDLTERLRGRGWRRSFGYRWLYGNLDPHEASAPRGDESVVIAEIESRHDLESFLELYRAGFSLSTTGSRQLVAEGWMAAVRQSVGRRCAGVTVRHLVARARRGGATEEALGIASIIVTDDGEAGLFNLAVGPEYRGRGVGRRLTDYRLALARSLGSELVFLQTEDDAVHRWQRAAGFVEAFVTTAWVANTR